MLVVSLGLESYLGYSRQNLSETLRFLKDKINKVEPPLSNHWRCQAPLVADGRWSLTGA